MAFSCLLLALGDLKPSVLSGSPMTEAGPSRIPPCRRDVIVVMYLPRETRVGNDRQQMKEVKGEGGGGDKNENAFVVSRSFSSALREVLAAEMAIGY